MSVAMKCFERLDMAHINTISSETPDPLQFAYRPNISTDDAISTALNTALSILYKMNNYVRMLFIDYSSAFNIIVPSKLITMLRTLGLNISLCNWILDFLTSRPQVVRVGNNTSATLILNTGHILSPLLYSLLTHDCVAMHDSNTIIKFSDDTAVVGLITDNDETAYREEVRDLKVWCQGNKEKEGRAGKGGSSISPFSSTGLYWSRMRASSSMVSTSPTHYHGPNTPRQP
jgi:hypothetical protein